MKCCTLKIAQIKNLGHLEILRIGQNFNFHNLELATILIFNNFGNFQFMIHEILNMPFMWSNLKNFYSNFKVYHLQGNNCKFKTASFCYSKRFELFRILLLWRWLYQPFFGYRKESKLSRGAQILYNFQFDGIFYWGTR